MFRSSNFPSFVLITALFLLQSWQLQVYAEDKCNLKSNKSCEDCVQDGIDKCTIYTEGSCKDCVEHSGCAYCEKNKVCMEFDLVKDTLNKVCEAQDWKYEQCVVTGKVLLVALPVTGFLVLVALICFFYCCCCRRKRNSSKDAKEDAKLRKQRKELSEKHKEREKERREKRDEIRKKYGLTTA